MTTGRSPRAARVEAACVAFTVSVTMYGVSALACGYGMGRDRTLIVVPACAAMILATLMMARSLLRIIEVIREVLDEG